MKIIHLCLFPSYNHSKYSNDYYNLNIYVLILNYNTNYKFMFKYL